VKDNDVDRLLRSAAKAKEDTPVEMPFGFDTRVVTLARQNGNGAMFALFLRCVTLAAAAVIVLAGAGVWLEFDRNADALTGSGNEFAIAESAIQDAVGQ